MCDLYSKKDGGFDMKLNKAIFITVCSTWVILAIRRSILKKRLNDLISSREEQVAPYKLEPAEL